ncbi:hypothetical protein HN858_04005 [Candidatus Falkowbacteria bacterium]|jgi:hypothetical protein|nr:hypothetical protein [Candidatus Falkowbacteria bacterium]MBT5502958.1 hypothetical protein [Candidatus Falkowbacteria bacterium]MBT6573549.1 hypothetical protein [Candidatus Falkowbacteria bacterium]MBT7348811.1 hypothetical protein [Candidatus Falkowbacteria bacterium]MBT7501222.1 hypothetical protein [Candidatus Falkowbacteria bacterium]
MRDCATKRDAKVLDLVLPQKFRPFPIGQETFRLPMIGSRIAWKLWTNQELLTFAKAYIIEHNIADSGDLGYGNHRFSELYKCLIRCELMHDLFNLESERPEKWQEQEFTLPILTTGDVNWEKFDNKKLENYAKAYCAHFAIVYREQLKKKKRSTCWGIRKKKINTQNFSQRNYRLSL